MQRTLSNPTGSSSFKLLKEVQAAGGVMRTVVAMKNTVMKIAVHNRQQVRVSGCPPGGKREGGVGDWRLGLRGACLRDARSGRTRGVVVNRDDRVILAGLAYRNMAGGGAATRADARP